MKSENIFQIIAVGLYIERLREEVPFNVAFCK